MTARIRSRYSRVAIALHWAIGLAILLMIWVGWWMSEAINSPDPATTAAAFKAFQFHKSLGLVILALTLVRLLWRLMHRPPPLPATMKGWERGLAHATHGVLYLLMLALPLSGWLYVSAGWNVARGVPFPVATVWFGLFEWPHIPGIATRENNARAAFAGTAMNIHAWLAWGALTLIVVHAVAALKHHLVDRDDVLARMLPLLRPRKPKKEAE
jgi:cytochrome b561